MFQSYSIYEGRTEGDLTEYTYSAGHSQHNTDFVKRNQNEVVRIRTNFFEYFVIHKLIRENKFVILNL